MNQLSVMSDEKTLSSVEIVSIINDLREEGCATLSHSDFMRKVAKVIKGGVGKFSGTYTHHQNGQTYGCYYLPKREASLMVMSESYEVQAKVYDRMEELEKVIKNPVATIPNFDDPIAAAEAWIVEKKAVLALSITVETQALQITMAQPAVNFVEQYADTSKSHCLSDVAKLLKYRPHEFMAMLNSDKIIFKRSGSWIASQKHIDAGRFSLKTGKNNGNSFVQTRVEPLGITWLAEKYSNYIDNE